MRFANRKAAGEALAQSLDRYRGEDCVVYALPRGGVVPGMVIAEALGCPLDLVIPRKIGHPRNREYAIAAVTENGEPVVNTAEVARVDAEWFEREVANQRREAARRRQSYLGDRDAVSPAGRTAILVDDGIATGLTMEAAVADVKGRAPARIVVAVPVAPADTVARLRREVDDVVAVEAPKLFLGGVGAYYADFRQVGDGEVVEAMENFRNPGHDDDADS